ncbi:MAG TPA: hypothetical protein PKH77_27840 [Anaerolineae bacterium]|nr:hypothetical protein [Anaerolineae bacterium]
MTQYLVKNLPNTALVSLDTMVPQPRSRGVQFTRTSYAANGHAYNEAPYIILQWSIIGSATAYAALLTQFGLAAGTPSNEVTVYVPNNVFTFTRYNGIAILPEASRENYFIRGVQIVVGGLVAL